MKFIISTDRPNTKILAGVILKNVIAGGQVSAKGISIVSAKIVPGRNVISVVYYIVFPLVQRSQKLSTFVSLRQHNLLAYTQRLEAARLSNFYTVSPSYAVTDTGHRTSLRGCTCPDSGVVKLNGRPICKHAIAYSKYILGHSSIEQFLAG